jgi:hypothetical protein
VVGVRALAVAFYARWSEGGIFGARDCAKWRARNIIYNACDFSVYVGAVKIHLRVIYRWFFGRDAILAHLLEMLFKLVCTVPLNPALHSQVFFSISFYIQELKKMWFRGRKRMRRSSGSFADRVP